MSDISEIPIPNVEPESNESVVEEVPVEEASSTISSDVVVASMGNAYQGQPNLDTEDPESSVYDGPETTVDRDFTYATYTDAARQRDPNGVYLDDLQRNEAEVIRAKVEDREPDLDNAPAIAGDVMVPVSEVAKNSPGDVVVPVVRTLPVSVGVASEDSE